MTTRRDFLRQVSSLAAITLLPAGRLLAESRLPLSERFSLGVASGDATSNSVILWTCYEGIFPIKLCVFTTDGKPSWREVHRLDGGFIVVDVSGLSSFKLYYYAFYEFDFWGNQAIARSVIGRFKTAPGPNDLVSLKFGAVSCIESRHEPAILKHAAAREDLDFFLLGGDSSYNDGAKNLEDFREKWRKSLLLKNYAAFRGQFSQIATIDDHEIGDNFDPEAMRQLHPGRLESGIKAFLEHIPMRQNREKPAQIWRKLSWGKTLDVFVLDCRTERLASQNQYISPEQMNWLKKGLLDSGAMFKVILNSVPIGEFPLPMKEDRWEGYPAQRLEILEHIDRHQIKNLLWVSGDFHFASLSQVSEKGPGANQLEVLAGPGGQVSNLAAYWLKTYRRFQWAYARNNYVTISCNVNSGKMEIEPVLGGI